MKHATRLSALAVCVSVVLCGCNNKPAEQTTMAASETTAAVTEAPAPTVDYGEMRDIPLKDLIAEMKTGWNLGNTLDAPGGETAWGNPVTTKEMIDFVAAAGFDVIRLPTTWDQHIDDENGYKIDEEWLARVHEIVDYAFDNGMYVILNTHHETNWIKPLTEEVDSFMPRFKALWTQIAESFEPYGDHLLFEGLNEPRVEGGPNEWNGGTKDNRAALNTLNKAFVETVRATGGNNSKRALLITTVAAAVVDSAMKALEFPEDDRVLMSLHAYTPYNFTYHSNSEWEVYDYSEQVGNDIDSVFDKIDKYYTDNGIPVIITEYGSQSKSRPVTEERIDDQNILWVKHYLERAKQSGIPCVWWDNNCYYGSGERFGIFDRRNMKWFVPDLVDAIMSVY